MSLDFSESIKHQLCEWAAEAHERELHRELTLLDRAFAEWRDGKISSRELGKRIHQYEVGPARTLYSEYHHENSEHLQVAYALVTGILRKDEVPEPVQESISSWITCHQDLKEQDDLVEPSARLRMRRGRED